jgi:archaellum component FlaC
MASAKEKLAQVLDGMGDDAKVALKEKSCGDGKVEVSGRFRMKKNGVNGSAAQDELPTLNNLKPTVKTKFADCKAKNPMRCRFHGALYAKNQLKALCDMLGVDGDSLDVKRIDEGTYDFMVKLPSSKVNAFKEGYGDFLADNGLEDYGASKDDGYYSFMYAAEEELDPNEMDEVETLKVDFNNAQKSIDELSGLKGQLSEDDLVALNDEIANQQQRVQDMDETLDMLGVKEYEDIGDVGFEEEAKADGFPNLPQLPASLDELTLVSKNIGGSTGPSLWQDDNGNKFILKTGGTAGGDPEGHVRNEYFGLKAYRAMGVFAPDAKMFTDKNGKTVMVENFVDGVSLGKFLESASPAQEQNIRQQIKDTSFADIVLGNWDCAGTPDGTAGDYPNMFVVNGKICRIDTGGWGRYRAQGELKKDSDWNDGTPNDLFSMKRIGTSADFLKDVSYYDLVQQIDGHDYTALLGTVPNADKAVLKKRIDAIRKLAARGRNYVVDGGYENKDFVDNVLELSYVAENSGAVESLSYAPFTFESLKCDSMMYAAVQQTGNEDLDKMNKRVKSLTDEVNKLQASLSFKFDETENLIVKTIDDINTYCDNGMAGPEPSSVDLALAKEDALRYVESELKKTIAALDNTDEDSMFASFVGDTVKTSKRKLSFVQASLKAVEKIKEWKNMKSPSGWVEFDYTHEPDFVLDDIPDTENDYPLDVGDKEELVKKYKQEIDGLNQKILAGMKNGGNKPLAGKSPTDIIDTLSKMLGRRIGVDTGWNKVSDMIRSQGYDVWPSDGRQYDSCHLMKIAELEAMGVDWESKPIMEKVVPPSQESLFADAPQFYKTKDGRYIYAGSWACKRNTPSEEFTKDYHKSSARVFNDTVHYAKKAPDEFKARMAALAAMKAVQSLIFENTKFEGADKTHVAITRTLPSYISGHYGLQREKYNYYPSATSESAAYGKVTTVSGCNDAMQMSIPVSRLTGMFCWNDAFEHHGENEFGVNTVGLPQYVCDITKIKPYDGHLFDNLNAFMQKNQTQTTSNTHTFAPKLA